MAVCWLTCQKFAFNNIHFPCYSLWFFLPLEWNPFKYILIDFTSACKLRDKGWACKTFSTVMWNVSPMLNLSTVMSHTRDYDDKSHGITWHVMDRFNISYILSPPRKNQHTETGAKWSTHCRWHFQTHFLSNVRVLVKVSTFFFHKEQIASKSA